MNVDDETDCARQDVNAIVAPALRIIIELLLKAQARPAIADHLIEALREIEDGYYETECGIRLPGR